jgi:DNA-binding response OmpR family regulator
MHKVLVVDDDLDILAVMQLLLKMKGFEVETTTKGEETFTKVETFKPDLILLDVLLSGYDGRIICKQLKSQDQTRTIPIIMFSAHPNAVETIHEYGADDFIAKPFDVNELLSKVNHQISKN